MRHRSDFVCKGAARFKSVSTRCLGGEGSLIQQTTSTVLTVSYHANKSPQPHLVTVAPDLDQEFKEHTEVSGFIFNGLILHNIHILHFSARYEALSPTVNVG